MSTPIYRMFQYMLQFSMMMLMLVAGQIAKDQKLVADTDIKFNCPITSNRGSQQCYYEALVRKYVFEKLNMKDTGFLPTTARDLIPPEWNDTAYRHEFIQGYVSDENAYAMGGIAGHV